MSDFTITPESYRTSRISPLVLSESERVQVSFEGQQVDNLHNLRKNIKGKLVIKKKNKSISSFSEIEKFGRKDIKSNEYIEISLDTEETYKLAEGLFNYYVSLGGKRTNPFSEITYVQKDDRLERLKELLNNKDDLLEVLSQIDISSINTAVNIECLRRVRQELRVNMDNDNERSFWQPFFEKNAWVLAQLFHSPVMLFEGNKYLGGKGIDDHGGQYADFLYKNEITDNVSIVEIKSPVKGLLGKEYRQVYPVSDELSGGVNQLIKQKNELLKEYNSLYEKSSKKGMPFNANNIECYLVIGNVGELNPDQKEVFDSYRNELRSVHIVGFDELLKRTENLLSLFEQR